jgi:hypothetical protein
MRKPDTCAPDSTAIRRCSDECAYSTTGDWNSGSLAFAISHGPYRTAPSASSSFSDMLFSPPAFAFRSIGWPRSISSELLLTASEIQPRVPRRTVIPAISSSLSNALYRMRLHDFRLCRLDDTRLEPTHVLIDCSPVDGRPVDLFVGDRASLCFHRCHPLCPDVGNSGFLVGKDRMEVCPLSRGVILPGSATPIRPITGRLSLSPSSFTRTPIGSPYGSLSQSGRSTGLPRFTTPT